MPVFHLFSKRQKKLSGSVKDVYIHDALPNVLKVQIIHILTDAIGNPDRFNTRIDDVYKYLHDSICREFGVFNLGTQYQTTQEALFNYFLRAGFEQSMDIIEFSFNYIDNVIRNDKEYRLLVFHGIQKSTPDDFINELNRRFKENAIGYQYEAGIIIKMDSTFVHNEIVKPTINLLWNEKFLGANEEYLKAHEHYKQGRNKECLAECLKAFESTMKIICKEKGWKYDEKDTSKNLIQECFKNNLIPSYIQNQFTSLSSLLESGIPTIRNRVGGHGQGQVPQKVDGELTRYGLNLTGTNIIFLVELSGIK